MLKVEEVARRGAAIEPRDVLIKAANPARHASWAAAAMAALFFVGVSALSIGRHEAFATGRHDLEIYSQVVWGLANGVPFNTTLLRTNTLHLAEHLALILLPLAPLYGLLPDPRLLLVVQQAALTFAALTVGWWASCRIGAWAGLAVLAACLLAPVLASISLDDFHTIVLATPVLAIGLTLALAGYPMAASLVVMAAALMEEEAALALAGLGLLMMWRRPRLLGAGMLTNGAVLLAVSALAIMPAFHDPGTLKSTMSSRSVGHFASVRDQPAIMVDRLLGRRGRAVVVGFILPTAGLALLSPSVLVAGAPTFLALLLQDREDTYTRHWSAPMLPVVWLAAVGGFALLKRPPRRVAIGLMLLTAGIAYTLASPLPGGAAFDPSEIARGPRERALHRALALVPPDLPTVVSANVAAHLANRRELFVYPLEEQYAEALEYQNRTADVYLLDFNDPSTQRVPAISRESPLTADPPFVMQSTAHKVVVLTRSAAAPTYPLDLLFGRGMALRGYDVSRAGDRVRLSLHWERVAGISADFRRNIELLDGSGKVLAEDGELELTRTLPTHKWQVGQQVRDEVELRAPAGSGSDWRARVQWQNREQGRPILLQDGSASIELAI